MDNPGFDAGLVSELRLKPEALARYGLPDIFYPVPVDLIGEVMDNSGELPFAELLYALQLHSAPGTAEWEKLEPGLARLAELLTPDDERANVAAAADEWWLEIGPVDLDGPIVTIQRRDKLIAAISSREDGRLRAATYRPLDAKSASTLVNLGQRPRPEDGTVCMRPSNWEYALDCSAGTGQYYAFERGEAYLTYWEHGLGLRQDRTLERQCNMLREVAPGRAALSAVELGVAYAFSGSR